MVKHYFSTSAFASNFHLAEEYMADHTSNIVVPGITFSNFKPEIQYMVLIGDIEDTESLALANPAKDQGLFPLETHGVATEADERLWQEQRSYLASSFLPGKQLAPAMPVLQACVAELLHRWDGFAASGAGIDLHAELHHFALDAFLRSMFGLQRGVLPPTPEDSKKIREAFALDGMVTPEIMALRQDFVGKILAISVPGSRGFLLDRICDMDGDMQRFQNLVQFIVAGHDTTAHTLQWLLLELARHPEVQDACSTEADHVVEQLQGRPLGHEDLRSFPTVEAVITEALRLWGPAWTILQRRLTREAVLKGRDGPVAVPAGTLVNFWYYGHQHCRGHWGDDACDFRPLSRSFTPQELQRGTAHAPASQRFHPFSLPRRDCLGKNFSLMEMRLLLPQLLRRFTIRVAESSRSELEGLRCGGGELFYELIKRHGPVKPPPDARFVATPRAQQQSRL